MKMRIGLCLTVCLLFALATAETPYPALVGGEPVTSSGPVASWSKDPVWGLDYVGAPEQIGTTWYDYQHNSGITRMIAYDDLGRVHCAWMKGDSGSAALRYVYYNRKSAAGVWMNTTGVRVDTSIGAGYTTLDVHDTTAYVAFHGPSPNNRIYVWSSATGIHILPLYPSTNPLVWPHIAVDDSGYIHIIAQTNPVGQIYRIRSMDGGVTWDAWTQIMTPAALNAVSQTACAGPPGMVAMAWIQPPAPEVYYIESTDNGANWGAPVNMTDFAGGTHPDAANSRARYNVNLLYGAARNLNATYTTVQYPSATNGGKIWFWSQATGHRYITGTYAANPWTALNPPGAWSQSIDKSALAYGAGILYVQWGQCTTPGDVSAANYGNWDVYATYSTDGGMNWRSPVNVTDTATPGAPPGQCLSESWASTAKVATDKLHVQYIKDLDAGGIPQSQGTWTNNPVIYQGVPVDSILTDMVVTLTPENPPIIIPPGGGSFNFTVEIENQGLYTVHFDAWIDVVLPNGSTYPILSRLAMTMNPGGSLLRSMTQSVPGGAPAGVYTYFAHVGNIGWNVYGEDSFPFSKSAVGSSMGGDWAISGWDEPVQSVEASPATHLLASTYPNPFNPTTTISFSLPQADRVALAIYDVSGREVMTLVNGWRDAGSHEVTFDGSHLASGVYLYRIKAGDLTTTGKMVLMK